MHLLWHIASWLTIHGTACLATWYVSTIIPWYKDIMLYGMVYKLWNIFFMKYHFNTILHIDLSMNTHQAYPYSQVSLHQ